MAKASNPLTTNAKPPIYLLDSMAFIFRAYHAMQRQRPMSTRTGIPTAATYVFVNMINKLRKDFQPEYLAAIYDVGAPVHRNELATQLKDVHKFNIKTQAFESVEYGGYKANRTETPPDLIQQQPYIRRALEAFRIPILYYEGFEADDGIGTLSCKLSALGHKVYVVSSDKDMMQLVNDDVVILNPTKDNLILDRAGVEQSLGVPPERVVDVMALRGDSVDNIPGAPGIGDKGSVELIQQFGSVEAALDRASEVKGKRYRESLENNRDTVLLSKELVTIHCEVPVELELENMRTQAPDVSACRALFNELEFTTMLKELAPEEEAAPVSIITDPSPEELSRFVTAACTHGLSLAFDTSLLEVASEQVAESESEAIEEEEPELKTMSLGLFDGPQPATEEKAAPPQTLKVAVSAEAGRALVFALDKALDNPAAEPLRAVLADEHTAKSLHDLKAALRILARHGADHGLRLAGPVDDLMLYSYLINPTHTTHPLPDVVARFSGRALPPPGDELLPASANAIRGLASLLKGDVETLGAGQVYRDIDLPLVPVLLRMEEAGVRIDRSVLADMGERLTVDMEQVSEQIFAGSGHRFNINSPKQLGDVLFNKMHLPKPMKYGRGKVVSTAVDVLEELAQHNEVPRQVLQYRQLAKLKSNYIDSLPLLADGEGRVHTTFNQVGTATGRLSSTNPNLQNIPIKTELGREIRAAFIAAPGNVLISADYSQIELRLMAHFSEDPLLLDAYRTGKDIHTLTASEVFGVNAATMDKETRARAKAVNFGIVYGISPFGLAAQLNIDQKTAKQYIETYFDRYKGVQRFIEETLETVRRDQSVKTYFGRIRPIPDIQSRNPNMRGFAERTAINTPLQGTAADLIKLAMLKIDQLIRDLKLKSQMTLQVHDELLFEVVPEEAEELRELVKREMEHVAEFSIPIVADVGIGENWRDIK